MQRELREAKLRGQRARLRPTDRWDTDLWCRGVARESRQTGANDSASQSSEVFEATHVSRPASGDVAAAPAVPVLASECIELSDPPSAEVNPAPQACTEAVERVQSVVGAVRHREFPENKYPESVGRTASQRQEHSLQSSQPQNRRQWAELRRRQRAAAAEFAKREKGAGGIPVPVVTNLPAVVFPDCTVDHRPTEQQTTVPAKPRRPRPR